MPVLTNARHEAFAQNLAKGMSAAAAYQAAGYSANDGNSIRLKGNERVAARVTELQAKAAARATVTLDSIAAELDADRQLAHDVKQPGAAVAATMGKAKLFGLLTEKREVTGRDGGPIEHKDVTSEIEHAFADAADDAAEGEELVQ